ncbi:MAG: acyltransferase [Desulfovibrio sp.]|nr:acyltransferase [Desulfovibrio sp.]
MRERERENKYRPDIDGLRALAVLLVVGYHAFPGKIQGGFIGVDIFFVISGYLITSLLIDDTINNRFSIITFYNRRIRRLLPALITVLIAILIFGYFALLPIELKNLGKHIFGGSFYISNFILWNESGYFDIEATLKPLLHLWSLGVEEQFYIFFPFVIFICTKYKLRIFNLIFILCLFSFFCLCYTDQISAFYSPISRAWELLSGASLSAIQRQKNINLTATKHRSTFYKNIDNIISSLGILLICIAVFVTNSKKPWPSFLTLLPICGSLFIIASGRNALINKFFLSNRIAIFIGLISYPLYLWHWPLLSFYYIIHGDLGSQSRLLRIGIVLISFLLATVTYYFIEYKIRFKYKNKTIPISLLIILTVIGLSGIAIYFSDGMYNRDNIKKYLDFSVQLKPYIPYDMSWKGYLSDGTGLHFCKFKDTGTSHTVAIVGDSFAGHTFHGLALLGEKYKFNTLLLGRFVPGGEHFDHDRSGKYNERIISILIEKKDIDKVFLCFRGMSYIDATDITLGYKTYKIDYGKPIGDTFFSELQKYVSLLNRHGKKVYIVSEIPTLPDKIYHYIDRPFKILGNFPNDFPKFTKDDVIKYQKKYLYGLQNIKNATIIPTIEKMCNLNELNECLVFTAGGLPTRYDNAHLSFIGSELFAETILLPYILD